MADASRRVLARAARRQADQQSDRLAAAASDNYAVATVKSLAPLTVTWRGGDVAAYYGSTYTPAVGHRVICAYTDDHQLVVLDRIIGP